MGFNWGGFAGGLSTGLVRGQDLRDKMDAREERMLEKAAQTEAGEAAKAARGLGAASGDEYQKYADQFAETNPEAAAAYSDAAKRANAGEAGYVAPTDIQRRTRGLTAAGQVYEDRGYGERAMKYFDQADQMVDREDTRAHNAKLRPLQLEASQLGIEKTRGDLYEANVTRELMGVVRGGKPAILDFYRKQVPDGWDVEERPTKGGGFELVQTKKEGGKTVYGSSMGKFKDDDDLATGVLMNAPKLVPDIIKTRMSHSNRMAEIEAQGKNTLAYANAIKSGGAGGLGLKDPKAYQAGVETHNTLVAEYAAAETPEERKRIGKSIQLNQITMANASGKPAQFNPGQEKPALTTKKFGDAEYLVPEGSSTPVARFDSELGQFAPMNVTAAAYAKNSADAKRLGLQYGIGPNEDGIPEEAFVTPDGNQYPTLVEAQEQLQRLKKSQGLFGSRNADNGNEAGRLGSYRAPPRAFGGGSAARRMEAELNGGLRLTVPWRG